MMDMMEKTEQEKQMPRLSKKDICVGGWAVS